jgi:class 3 adenylate cyclase
MSNATETENQAYNQFASHLRRNPDAVNHSSRELAELFGIPEQLVHDVQEAVKSNSDRRLAEPIQRARLLTPVMKTVYGGVIRPVGRKAHKGWCFSTSSPSWFVGITTFIGIAAFYALGQYSLGAAGSDVRAQLDGASAVIALGILLLQFLCFFRHGMARHAFYGALVNWVIASTLAIVATWMAAQGDGRQKGTLLVFALPFLLLIVAAVYAGVGVVVAVAGGYMQLRRADAQKGKLSRQQLLERMFEIEERLRRGPTGTTDFFDFTDLPLLQKIRRHTKTSAVIAGLGIGLLWVLLAGWLLALHGKQTGSSGYSTALSIVGVVVAIAWGFIEVGLSFLARSTGKAFVACGIFALCSGLPVILPLPGFGWEHFLKVFSDLWLPLGGLTVVISLVASAGAVIEERADRERRLRHNDPATLLAEMLEVQYILTPTTTLVCVMVVDAARSADMKAAADPLLVEYSFREYQQLISGISLRFGGNVHSTAGDGAVVSFPSCTEAFAAAKRIQTDIEDFNRETNRLKSPFRLRIGLHVGKVAGELEQVQFAEVIDIAAHVQDVAPVGGIAMTELVSEQLGGEPAVQLKEPVDGHTVMLVLNPTVDR